MASGVAAVPWTVAAFSHPVATGLPVEEVVDDLRHALAGIGAAVLQAEPGAGKTTVVPLRLLDEPWMDGGRMLLLEPRRVAARAAARGWRPCSASASGRPSGSTRDERRVTKVTRIEVVTDGILTRRLQRIPAFDGVALVIFDEFHERHLQADLGLALTLDAALGLRPELRVLVMSATLDSAQSRPSSEGRPSCRAGKDVPVDLRWMPQRPNARLEHGVAAAVHQALEDDSGDVLVFLPGVGEINTGVRSLGDLGDVDVLPLHGTLPTAEQDRALRAGTRRRIVVSHRSGGVQCDRRGRQVVVDSGLARRPAFDAASGLSRVRTITPPVHRPISAPVAPVAPHPASPTGCGRRPSTSDGGRGPIPRSPVRTSHPRLELAAWGAPAGALRWLDPPPPGALAVATSLLAELGVLADGRPTDLGRQRSRPSLAPQTRPDVDPGPGRRPPDGLAPGGHALGAGHRPARRYVPLP